MKPSQPYQPLLFRILHGLTGVFLIAAILTAFWTYDTYDGRWGRVPLPYFEGSESLHGTFGLFTLLIFPLFLIYAFHRGQRRLIQPDFVSKMTQLGKPIWWYTLSRATNTLSLLALTFALFSGKMMDEKWLPNGELDHLWYYAHLLAWILMVLCIALHVLLNAKVGGLPLLLSVFERKFREKDHPALWLTHLSQWASTFSIQSAMYWAQENPLYGGLEVTILITLAAAWIIPLVS